MVIKAAGSESFTAYKVVGASIYGSTLIILYTMSCIYHALSPRIKGKKVLRVIDHCSVFILIAGTYTPITLVTLNGWIGWTIFGVVWGISVVGIILNCIDLEKFKKFSVILYVILGWTIVIAFKPLFDVANKVMLTLLIVGGVVYTIGAVLYAMGHKAKYIHSLFHFFVIAGTILQFIAIFGYVL